MCDEWIGSLCHVLVQLVLVITVKVEEESTFPQPSVKFQSVAVLLLKKTVVLVTKFIIHNQMLV